MPRHTTSYDELLSWVDVVYIAVPNILHVKYTRAALEAGRHVIVEKPMAPTAALAEELAELARSKKLFLFEAVTTQYQDNYAKIREVLPKVGAVTMVQCNFSQYSSRYHDFCAGKVWPSFDPACAGGALMDLGVYNVSYVVGLFGSPNKVHYAANITRGIDTSGVLTMEYRSFKAVSINAKDSSSPARYIIQGTKGYLLQKSTANFCGGVTFHPIRQGRALQPQRRPSPAGGGVPRLCPRHRERGYGALQPDAGHLGGRQSCAGNGPPRCGHPLHY